MSCLPLVTIPSAQGTVPQRRRLPAYAATVFALAALLTGCLRLNEKPPAAIDLSGDWQLRQSLSDDPGLLLKPPHRGKRHDEDTPTESRTDGDEDGQRGGGSGMPGGRQFASDHSRGGGPDFAMLRNLLAQPAELSIRQLPREVRLTADGSPTRYVYGQDAVDSVQDGVAERTAGWKGQAFIIKYEVRQGPEAIRSYEKDTTGRWLTVTTQVSGGGAPKLKIHTVYERKPAR